MMKGQVKRLAARIGAALRSSRGKDVLLYLLFVAVSFVFWMLLALDTERQRDFDVPFELQDVPDSVTMISNIPAALSVSVKGKDSQLLRFVWGRQSPIKFKWSDYASDDVVNITASRLEGRLRDYFGASVQLMSSRPDSLRLLYTTQPGKRVKVTVESDIRPNLQYILSGPVTATPDSVTLFSATDIPHSLLKVSTEPVIKSGLRDTARYEVKIKPIEGIRIIPDKVTVTVPVEPLISRRKTVRLDMINVPDGVSLVIFPSSIEVTYLVPMSVYNDEFPISAYVDYNDTRLPGSRIPVKLSTMPETLRNVSKSTDSVDYIIENE